MAEIPFGFSFEETEEGFSLHQRTAEGVTTITMSPEDLSGFKAAIALWSDRTMSKMQVGSGPVQPIVAHWVAQARLRPDAVQENVLLTVRTPSGGEMTFSFPLSVADCVAAELPALLEEIRAANPIKQ